MGFGTTLPTALLHVVNGSDPRARFTLNNNNILTLGINSTESYFWNETYTRMSFGTNNQHRMTIQGDGAVGIGTTSPTALLQVNGTARVGALYATNGFTLGGAMSIQTNTHHVSSDGGNRLYYYDRGPTQFGSYNDYYWFNGEGSRTMSLFNDARGLWVGTRLGIGISHGGYPNAPLHVGSYVDQYSDTWAYWYKGYLNPGVVGGTTYFMPGMGSYTSSNAASNLNVSIYGEKYIVTNVGFAITSDLRIKTNIIDIKDDKALNDLRLLQPKTFNFIDRMNEKPRYGFIAQEVEKIFPYSIVKSKGFIPNFLVAVDITFISEVVNNDKKQYISRVVYKPNNTTHNADYKFNFTGNHDISGNEMKNGLNQAISDLSGNQRFKLLFYKNNDNRTIEAYSNKIINDTEFIIVSDENVEGTQFLIGQDVDDFCNLDYNGITCITTAALQEVDRQQQADKARIAELESTVATQQSLINDILERLKTLEA
jgi:hypothetical protein